MNKLNEDLANRNLKNIYLLYGSQAYLRNQYRDKIIKAFNPMGDELNVNRYSGEGVPVNEIIDLAETMPFMSDYRIIVVENSGLFKDGKAEDRDKLEEYLQNVCETTCIIFSEEEVDGRMKITKTIKSKGSVTQFEKLTDDMMRKWFMGKLRSENKMITNEAYDYFMKSQGTDMYKLTGELEKLLAYTYGRDAITIDDVKAICTQPLEDKVFDMLDAMFSGNSKKALKFYGDLLELMVAPIKTLALVREQLRFIYHVKVLSANGLGQREIAKELGANEYRVQKSLPHAKKSSKIWLEKGIALCTEVERAFKSGGMDIQIGLETVICSLSGVVDEASAFETL